MAKFVKVAKTLEMEDESVICVEVEGKRIALFNLGGEFCAIDNTCTHRGGPLSEGVIEGEEVVCPWHGGQFNIRTGEATGPPPCDNVTTYTVRVMEENIEIEL